jgi:hypothetical protein
LFGVDFVVPHPNPDWLKGTGEGVQGAEAWFNGSVDKLLPGTIPAGDRGGIRCRGTSDQKCFQRTAHAQALGVQIAHRGFQ